MQVPLKVQLINSTGSFSFFKAKLSWLIKDKFILLIVLNVNEIGL